MKATNEHIDIDQELIKSSSTFPVVGVGASAGGLDAFKKLLTAIPEDSGMAFVLVQHLDPNHESLLPDLLQKVTRIPVLEISDDIKVQPDHIYIIPSNKMLVANDGVLQLTPRIIIKNERNLPVDLFFASLAEVHQSRSIGVVLSGTASDGTRGLQAIKEQGGITIAQSQDTASFDGMPQSAILAGVVDFILPPELIPQKLIEITKITHRDIEAEGDIPQQDEDLFKQMLSLLRVRKGTDFTYYKQTTIRRRILRRMALNKSEEPGDYLRFLRAHTEELDILYQDLLIPVTSFFRDPKSFEHLCETIFPQIIESKKETNPIRIWIAGCSTGQEVYSMAICLKEFLGNRSEKVQLFATDISEPAILKARTGIYNKSELENLSPQRLQEFFTKTNDGYQVNSAIRDICVFAVHNFLKDPPFGKLDLISCRNVLIYMEPYLQKKALTTFHYSLNYHGFLWLGKSETISSVPELFSLAYKGDKIFSRKDVPAKYMLSATVRSEQNMTDANVKGDPDKLGRTDFQKAADDLLLSNYTPAGVVVNEAMDIVYFRGKTGNYLEQATGKPSHNIIKMAKEGLAFELRNILHKARKEKAPVRKESIQINDNGILRNISIEATLLPKTMEPHYIVLFQEDVRTGLAHEGKSNGKSGSSNTKDSRQSAETISQLTAHVSLLERELSQLREDMRSITEDQEAVNEELQSANEELLSSSEELQSLNEELETGKEELQSTNEELTVLNQELVGLNLQVIEARNYAETIIATLREPLLVLDKNLRIVSGNRSFYKAFRVTEKNTEGKLFYQLGDEQWNITNLKNLLENILPNKQSFTDFEVSFHFPAIGQRTMLMNASEILREKGTEKLILVSFEDITERVELMQQQKAQTAILENAVAQRTNELQQSNKELIQSNEDLQRFAHVASHDLREPLRKIITFTNRLRDDKASTLSDNGNLYLSKVVRASERMDEMIKGVLNYSLVSSFELAIEKIDLNETIKNIEIDLEIMIQQKEAIISYNELPQIEGAPVLIYQLFYNLVYNALKFAKKEGKLLISIQSKVRYSGVAAVAEITIEDNGIGFDKGQSENIFIAFARLNSKDDYEGTGLGLTLCKKIAERHGGSIRATSVKNKGAMFIIILPLKHALQ